MPLILALIGAALVLVALRNTQSQLATALEQDVPGYLKWVAAIAAIGALGYIKPLEVPSRWLLALVLMVIVLTNYQQIFQSFQSLGTAPTPTTPPTNPTTAAEQALSGPAGLQSSTISALSGLTPGAGTSAQIESGGFGSSSIPGQQAAAGGGLF